MQRLEASGVHLLDDARGQVHARCAQKLRPHRLVQLLLAEEPPQGRCDVGQLADAAACAQGPAVLVVGHQVRDARPMQDAVFGAGAQRQHPSGLLALFDAPAELAQGSLGVAVDDAALQQRFGERGVVEPVEALALVVEQKGRCRNAVGKRHREHIQRRARRRGLRHAGDGVVVVLDKAFDADVRRVGVDAPAAVARPRHVDRHPQIRSAHRADARDGDERRVGRKRLGKLVAYALLVVGMDAADDVVAKDAQRLLARHSTQKRKERIAEVLGTEALARLGAQQHAAVLDRVEERLQVGRRSADQAIEPKRAARPLAFVIVDDKTMQRGALRLGQRAARVVVQLAERAGRLAARHRNAHGDGRLDGVFPRPAGAAQKLQDQPGDALDGVQARNVFHQHDELAAVRAGDQIRRAEHCGEDPGGVGDDRVPRLAAEPEVDVVKRVVVDDEQRMRALLPGGGQQVVGKVLDGFVGVQAGSRGQGERRHASTRFPSTPRRSGAPRA